MRDPSEFNLELISQQISQVLTGVQLKHAQLSRIEDVVLERIIYRLHWYTAGRRTEYSHPSTWWQAFKLAYFPTWLLHFFPIKYKTIRAYQLFPDLPFDLGESIHYLEGF